MCGQLCRCGHFWGYCVVCGKQPQQQLLSAHCCGAVTAEFKKSTFKFQTWISIFNRYLYPTLVIDDV